MKNHSITDGMRKHFKERMKERFKIKIKTKDRLQIIANIKKGNFKDITSYDWKQRPIYRITWKGKVLHIVYDTVHEELVTALYPTKHSRYVHNSKKHKKKNKKDRWKSDPNSDIWKADIY